MGPASRYGGVLYIEKEGFDPLLQQVQLAERHDLALMSCKGLSVTAARELVDRMCAKYGLPLFVLTDFDKAGFSGVATFQQDGRRYKYQNEFKVTHLGLRLTDVRDLGIENRAETAFDRGSEDSRRENLAKNGATEEEIAFLLMKRVELNAMTSDQFVAFIERKLQEHGVRKVVPKNDELAAAFRLFKRGVRIRKLVEDEIARLRGGSVPADLRKRVQAYLAQHPEMPWDVAVAHIAGWK